MSAARFRVGKRGQTYVAYQSAAAIAAERHRPVWLVVGSRAVFPLPARFTLVERRGALVHQHYAVHGRLQDGTGRGRGGPLTPGDPWVNVDYGRGTATLTTPDRDPAPRPGDWNGPRVTGVRA